MKICFTHSGSKFFPTIPSTRAPNSFQGMGARRLRNGMTIFAKELISSFLMIAIMLSIVSLLLLNFTSSLLNKFLDFSFPGLIFANPLLLLCLSEYLPIANLPVRIAEAVLGRLSLGNLSWVILGKFSGALLGVEAVRAMPIGGGYEHEQSSYFGPVEYPHDRLIFNFAFEALITACFVVVILVVPELWKINKQPTSFLRKELFTALVLTPFYLINVGGGFGSTFSPESLYALCSYGSRGSLPVSQTLHLVGPLLGSLLGGWIMLTCFPDDPNPNPNTDRLENNII